MLQEVEAAPIAASGGRFGVAAGRRRSPHPTKRNRGMD
jgi:hypothetical protein